MIELKLLSGGRDAVPDRRELTRAMRGAGEAAGEFHLRHHMPEHFERTAFSRYSEYAERSPNYDRWKSRRKGHRRPLVKTGALRRDVLGGAPRVSRKRGGETVQVGIHVPRYVWFRRRWASGRIGANKAAELMALRPEELAALAAVYGDVLEAAMSDRRIGRRSRKS